MSFSKKVRSASTLRVLGLFLAVATVVAFVSVSVAGSLGRVVVNSSPSGAKVVVGKRTIGTTPVDLKLPADGSSVRLRISKAGFRTKSVSVKPKANRTTRVRVKLSPK